MIQIDEEQAASKQLSFKQVQGVECFTALKTFNSNSIIMIHNIDNIFTKYGFYSISFMVIVGSKHFGDQS